MNLTRQRESLAKRVIDVVLRQGVTTRKELLQHIPVRPATLFSVIRTLTDRGILVEPERKGKKTGRKASLIRLSPDYGYFLGIDLDIPYALVACIDGQGTVLASARCASAPDKDAAAAKTEVLDLIGEVRAKMGADWQRIRGVGFADPGLVSPARGVSLKAVNVNGWENVGTRDWLKRELGLESVIYPAVTVRAYAEYVHRCPQAPPGLFHMQLNLGIGGGFIKDGEPFIGDSCCAMEVGHVVVVDDGPLCQCGNRGCLEAVAGLAALRRRVEELNQRGVQTELQAAAFSFAQLIACVEQNDKAARALTLEIAEYVGAGLAAVVSVLNPACVVLSGGLAGLENALLEPVRRVVGLRCLPVASKDLDLCISNLPEHATAVGAALLMRKKALFEDVEALRG